MPEFVRAEVKSVFAPDVSRGDHDLAEWQPPDPEIFGTPLMIFIGSAGSPLSDAFHATVCSPKWLSQNLAAVPDGDFEGGVTAGKHLLIMARWDYETFNSALEAFVAKFTGPTWGDVANRIGRVLFWEFQWKYDDQQDRDAEAVSQVTLRDAD